MIFFSIAGPIFICNNMRLLYPWSVLLALLCASHSFAQKPVDPATYLDSLKAELVRPWPGNRTINLVFHGHSVPAGYFKTPVVNTLQSYPNLLLQLIKAQYPHAVVNVIVTAIGGENSASGSARFEKEVLAHSPDVIFIDYSLNDIGLGLDKARTCWEEMIRQALNQGIPVILLTPTPDQRFNILDSQTELKRHADQVISLAQKFQTGLIDSYGIFRKKVESGIPLTDLMSQVNHPNAAGHLLVAQELFRYFQPAIGR